MNKIALITVISISILLTGCGAAQTPHQNSPTKTNGSVVITHDPTTSTTTARSLNSETKKQPYLIKTATFSRGNIKVQYPQINGLADKFKEKTINDLIKNNVLTSEVKDPFKFYQADLTLDLKYQVTMNTNELLSVIYTGSAYVEGGAFPTNEIQTITIDLKKATQLKLSDFMTIDTNLAQKIKQSTAVTNDAVKYGMHKDELMGEVQSNDDQTLTQGFKEQWGYYTFHVTPNSLVVSVQISHAGGDYALVELAGNYTKKY